MKGGIMIALGKGGPPPSSDEEKGEAEGPEHDYAREAYSAIKDGDEDGFVQAFLGAVRACKGKDDSGDPEEEGEEG